MRTYVEVLTDDIDGKKGEGIETHYFAVDWQEYEIELRPRNAKGLQDVVDIFKEYGRRVRVGVPAKRKRVRTDEAATIREWARSAGIKVNDHGRIPERIVQSYQMRHAAPEPVPDAAPEPPTETIGDAEEAVEESQAEAV
jgi:nucleoid-associated protein Lsr2